MTTAVITLIEAPPLSSKLMASASSPIRPSTTPGNTLSRMQR